MNGVSSLPDGPKFSLRRQCEEQAHSGWIRRHSPYPLPASSGSTLNRSLWRGCCLRSVDETFVNCPHVAGKLISVVPPLTLPSTVNLIVNWGTWCAVNSLTRTSDSVQTLATILPTKRQHFLSTLVRRARSLRDHNGQDSSALSAVVFIPYFSSFVCIKLFLSYIPSAFCYSCPVPMYLALFPAYEPVEAHPHPPLPLVHPARTLLQSAPALNCRGRFGRWTPRRTRHLLRRTMRHSRPRKVRRI